MANPLVLSNAGTGSGAAAAPGGTFDRRAAIRLARCHGRHPRRSAARWRELNRCGRKRSPGLLVLASRRPAGRGVSRLAAGPGDNFLARIARGDAFQR